MANNPSVPSPAIFTFGIYTFGLFVYNEHIEASDYRYARTKLWVKLKRRYPHTYQNITVNKPQDIPAIPDNLPDSFTVRMFSEGVMGRHEGVNVRREVV